MTSSDLQWLIKIFNDKKRRVVSLRQLSFLFYIAVIAVSILPAEEDAFFTSTLCSEKPHCCFLAQLLEKVTNLHENFRQNS